MTKNNIQNKNKTAKAKLSRARISPRKSRMVADLIRESSVEEAQAQLLMSPRRGSDMILKLLKSAIANAKNNQNMDTAKLKIEKIIVNEGPTYKRWMPRAMGRATPIHKKTSHITITLTEDESVNNSKFIIPERKIEKSDDSSSGQSAGSKDYEESREPLETKQPAKSKSKNPMSDMFRRKSV